MPRSPFPLLRPSRLALACALGLGSLALSVHAGEADAVEPAAPAKPVQNSAMDAPMFYQLLVGEMELRSGEMGVAYQVLLDAARRTQDEPLYKRVVQIAVQGRAGEQALVAAKAWRDGMPGSLEAHQTTLQLLALLNKPQEIAAPVQSLLKLGSESQSQQLLRSLPGLFARTPEPQRVLEALQPTLQASARNPALRQGALLCEARLQLAAGHAAPAWTLTEQVLQQEPGQEEALGLALDLMDRQPPAEAPVRAALAAKPDHHGLRQAYARALARSQRLVEAAAEFRRLTVDTPEQPTPWYALGSLELELHHPERAEAALQTFLKRLEDSIADGELSESGREARQQAWLLLSRVAEQRKDWKTAQAWLDRIEVASPRADLSYRKALLLARQGRLDQARQVIHELPGETDEQLRTRFMAESQLLRDLQQWPAAYELLGRATARLPADADLLYEQAMMAEKLNLLDEMEQQLRRTIEISPKHFHAYNALGYSLADRKLRLDEARELIVKALSLAPKEPAIVDSMGWVEYRLGRLQEAQRWLAEAYASRPDGDIAAHLGEVLWQSGQKDKARQVWAEGLKREPGNEAILEARQRLQAAP
ncbi:tetratricopeptide repeat protein [Mitsuaria sp. WAJ17]|uniref:tetratricopeptide repeat protein n=1 Tax=Mitsuaria sp. WAJ17 TaxID=2761452 RepID=UPI0015FF76C9|nr:tetratricopeptide repeat protein [Mitsuaria sp. WAJ17]MBB2485050.1 tetratricopeptide repeat protein [Mitsuaria sp. WAJ17]